jgi:hypothetical protein
VGSGLRPGNLAVLHTPYNLTTEGDTKQHHDNTFLDFRFRLFLSGMGTILRLASRILQRRRLVSGNSQIVGRT